MVTAPRRTPTLIPLDGRAGTDRPTNPAPKSRSVRRPQTQRDHRSSLGARHNLTGVPKVPSPVTFDTPTPDAKPTEAPGSRRAISRRHEIPFISCALQAWIGFGACAAPRTRHRRAPHLFERHRDRGDEWGVDGEEVTVVGHEVAARRLLPVRDDLVGDQTLLMAVGDQGWPFRVDVELHRLDRPRLLQQAGAIKAMQ